MLLLGDTTTPLPPEFLAYANLGAFALFFALALRGYIWPRPAVDDLKEALKEVRAENLRLNQMAREAWVPALTKANEATDNTADALEQVNEALVKVSAAFGRLEDEIRRLGWTPRESPRS